MSIATQISRIQGEKSKIAIKLSDMGLAESTADLETLATAIDNIPNKGAVTATVRQGESYTIPAGYHNGSGTVTGLDNPDEDASKYMLQTKIVNPNKSVQSVTADQGYYGLSAVTVGAIPAAYQNVTQVDATASDVLANKKIVTKDGTVVAGTMPNNGAVSKTLTAGDGSYTIPKGYHDGTGEVAFLPAELDVTPSKQAQTFTASDELYVQVNVAKIPDKYLDTSDTANHKDSSNLTKSGPTVTVPAGYYPNDATASIDTVAQAKIDITVSEDGIVTADAMQGEGYVAASNEETTYQLPTQGARTITPDKTLTQIAVQKGKFTTGVIDVAPIPAKYIDTTDATAIANNILKNKTAYVSGAKVTGTMENRGNVGTVEIDALSNSPFYTILSGYYDGGEISISDTLEAELAKI